MNWTQLKTVLWLRWRLTRNQFARKGGLNTVIAVAALVIGLSIAAGAGVGGIFAGAFGLAHVSTQTMMLVWDGIVAVFFFFWLIGVLAEIQRSESIDLARLLHLPVTLEGIFVINYIASHLTMSIIVFLPAMLGLCLGLMLGKGWLMIFLFPLVVGLIFMITAWTYCVRGWLIALMVNPRRRRNIVVVITLAIMLLGQGPNLYWNVYLRTKPHQTRRVQSSQSIDKLIPAGLVEAHDYVPLLWLPRGAMTLNEGHVLPAVLGALGAFLIGTLGLARAYRSTMRFYTGQEKVKATPARQVAVTSGAPSPVRKYFMEKRVPFVSEDVAALSLAFFRSLSRAPEIKIAMFTNLVIIIMFTCFIFSATLKTASDTVRLFSGTGAVALTFFGLMQLMFNQFGQDRDGFRMLVLSPARRRDILLAKNLALSPFVFGLGAVLLIVMVAVMRLPALVVVAAFFKLGTMYLLLSLVGNFVSTLVPYRITAGSLKPTKPPPKVVFLMMATQLLSPVAMAPIALPPVLGIVSERFDLLPAPVVDVILSFGLLGLAVVIYQWGLDGLGDFLERREQKILLVVSQEVE